jgi:hypothetical protein
MKEHGVVDVYIHIFLTSALGGGEWSSSLPGRFNPGERAPGTLWIGGWVGPIAGLEHMEKRKSLTLRGIELRPLGRPASSQSLYRLRHPDSCAPPPTQPYKKQSSEQRFAQPAKEDINNKIRYRI